MAALLMGGSLIQGSFRGEGTDHGNLEAVLARPLSDGLHEVQHYWRDLTRPDRPWRRGAVITRAALGPAWITQRADVGDAHGNFEVVVPERLGDQIGLAHFWLDNSIAGARPWNRVQGWAAAGADGPGAVVENRTNGNLEAVVRSGSRLEHHRFDRVSWLPIGTSSSSFREVTRRSPTGGTTREPTARHVPAVWPRGAPVPSPRSRSARRPSTTAGSTRSPKRARRSTTCTATATAGRSGGCARPASAWTTGRRSTRRRRHGRSSWRRSPASPMPRPVRRRCRRRGPCRASEAPTSGSRSATQAATSCSSATPTGRTAAG